jgi:hypothetical protein
VRQWFERALERCTSEKTEVPVLVQEYLDLFDAWDAAFSLRTSHRELIEAVQQSESPQEWDLVRGWLWAGDQLFFDEVLATPVMKDLVKHHDLKACTSGSVLGRNELLQLWKQSWTLPSPGPGPETVNVHFESRARGQIQVDVEIEPYEGSLDKKPARCKELERQLAVRARVNQALRDAILADTSLASRLGAHTRYLREPTQPSTCCAVKFHRPELGTGCSVEHCAGFFVEVIESVVPVVDRVTKETMQ